MPTASPKANDPKAASKDDPGARSAWGLIIGAVIGSVVGAFFHQAVTFGLCAAAIGWIIGAFRDRSAR